MKLVCRNPLRATLDGEQIIACDERTVVIPAYHRADRRKCAKLELSPGAHELSIDISDARDFEELYFMLVSEELYCAYRVDSMFD